MYNVIFPDMTGRWESGAVGGRKVVVVGWRSNSEEEKGGEVEGEGFRDWRVAKGGLSRRGPAGRMGAGGGGREN